MTLSYLSYENPYSEFNTISNLMGTLYSKCQELDKQIEIKEKLLKKYPQSAISEYSSAGLNSISMYENTEQILAIIIAKMYEGYIRYIAFELHKLGRCNRLYDGNIFKNVRSILESLKIEDIFQNDLLKSWPVLIRIRNIFCHSSRFDKYKQSTLENLKKDLIDKNNFNHLITCLPDKNILSINKDFFVLCMNDFIKVVTKFESLLGQHPHTFEIYVLSESGYSEGYEELESIKELSTYLQRKS